MTLLSVMIATIRMVAPHAREQRVDLVDAADQLGPALPEQLALGRIGLGANRRTDGDRRVYAANIAPGFRCDVSEGIISGRGTGCSADALEVAALDAGAVRSFLGWLENQRSSGARTRNHRLAAIKAFARYVASVAPESLERRSQDPRTPGCPFRAPRGQVPR